MSRTRASDATDCLPAVILLVCGLKRDLEGDLKRVLANPGEKTDFVDDALHVGEDVEVA